MILAMVEILAVFNVATTLLQQTTPMKMELTILSEQQSVQTQPQAHLFDEVSKVYMVLYEKRIHHRMIVHPFEGRVAAAELRHIMETVVVMIKVLKQTQRMMIITVC